MFTIVKFFWQMCLLQRSPSQLPSSTFSTSLIFFVYLLISLTVVSTIRPQHSGLIIVSDVAIGIIVQALVTYLLLQYKNLTTRFKATWSSLLGTNALMLLVLLPVSGILMTSESERLLLFADSLTWVCLGWWLAIAGYIYHKAVHISVIQGSVLAFLTELLAAVIAFNLVPR